MKITLAGKEYTAPTPMTGLWYDTQKIKTEQEQRFNEIQDMWKKIAPYENNENISDSVISEVEKNMTELAKKTDSNKRLTLESQINVIVKAFKNENVTLETILEYLPLEEVRNKYFEIENWLNDILAGRTAQLPNEETPTA